MSKNQKIYSMTATALMTAIICVLAPFSVPIGPVSLTLQNFVIGLAAVILGWKMATASCAIYLLLGMIGVPVFSRHLSGVDKIVGPTGGYLIGFLLFAAIGGFLINLAVKNWGLRDIKTWIASVVSLAIGDAVLYVVGTIWFMYIQQVSLPVALGYCVFPFIGPDLIKFVLAAGLGLGVRSALAHAGILNAAVQKA